MSSDLGLIPFKDGKEGPLSSALVLKVLKPFILPIDDENWELSFPDGSGGDMLPVLEDHDAFGICINRPHGAALFDALYEIMRQTHTLMYWTGSRDMITADPSIAEHLPPDYIEIYGMPALVHSGADILAEIAKT